MVFYLSKIKINKKERENYITQNVYISKSKRFKQNKDSHKMLEPVEPKNFRCRCPLQSTQKV